MNVWRLNRNQNRHQTSVSGQFTKSVRLEYQINLLIVKLYKGWHSSCTFSRKTNVFWVFGERVMFGATKERNACYARVWTARCVSGLVSVLCSASLSAAPSESPYPAIQIHAESHQIEHPIASDQVALVQYNSGHRAEAVKVWQSLAEQGDSEAAFTLAVLYNRGDGGVPKDMIEAVRWYRKAAEQGHVIAQYNLGVLYATGTGVTRDFNAAVQWWRMAALQGHSEAQFNLGLYYAEGTGVRQDPAEAVKWWAMAAKQGYAAAQFNLGLMYMKGEGVDENQDEAVRLWRKSADQGFNQAITVLKVLNLTP
jgi:TPR repeat protein